MNSISRPSEQDFDEIHLHGSSLWPALEGKRLFISGGTGFFGCWLLETFDYLTEIYRLQTDITVLSRNPETFVD